MRDGVGQSVCFTDLTKEERAVLLADKDVQFLKNLCCYLADRIQELGDIIEEHSQQLLLDDLAIGRASGEKSGGDSGRRCAAALCKIRKDGV